MEQIPIKKLMDDCVSWMRQNGYTEYTIGVYDRRWRHGIVSFMNDRGMTDFTVDIGEAFLSGCHSDGYLSENDQCMRRSVRVLCEFLLTGRIKRKSHPAVNYQLDGEIGLSMELLLEQCLERQMSNTTIAVYRRHLWRFLTFLSSKGVKRISEIGSTHIIAYIDGYGYGDKYTSVSVLRKYFRLLAEKDHHDKDLSLLLYGYRKPKMEKIPSYYTTDEVAQMEDYALNEAINPKGRRNYAMLLLASRLGLRASDIAALSFDNLKWKQEEIVLTMYKTGKTIKLPLLPEVGNAIVDYLDNGRPVTYSRKVFLSAKAPYEDATSDTVQFAIRSIIEECGIKIGNRHHGPHSMRHTLASRLLENGVAMPVISASLGHKSTVTTNGYLRIDENSLRGCALDVPEVNEKFYTKKRLLAL